MPKIRDLTGRRFGDLTVKSITDKRKNGHAVWMCECDCGEICYKRACDLTTGRAKSCSCKKIVAARKNAPLDGRGLKIANANNLVEKTDLRALNRKIPSNNTSGKTGVSWSKEKQKWHAKIGFKGQTYNIGYFNDFDEAVRARTEAEKELFTPILEEYGRI